MMLEHEVAVVYGAGGAIGGAVTRTFASEGANLYLTGRQLAPVEAVAVDIASAGGSAEAAEVDALDEHAALPVMWTRVLLVELAVGLVSSNVTTFGGVRPAVVVTGSRTLLWDEWLGTVGVVVLVVLPFLAGGLTPDGGDFVPAILLGLGFASTCVLVLTLFDVAKSEKDGS